MTITPPGPHGGDGARLADALGVPVNQVLDLSASLNPVAPDLTPTVVSHLDSLRRYPDPASATSFLAGVMDVAADRLLLTNGGAEAIALVAAELGPARVEEPEFSLYRRHLSALDPDGPRWRSNPHNPTGALAEATEQAAVWDEAFWPLATGTWTRGDADRGSVVLGSLTKLLACPGLRIGYVICPDPDLRWRLAERQPAWSVNGLVCDALPDLLGPVDLPRWSIAVNELRRRLRTVLADHGYAALPSRANWLLVEDCRLRGALAAQGILVRDCASFGMPGTVRIAVPDAAGLDRLQAALSAIRVRP